MNHDDVVTKLNSHHLLHQIRFSQIENMGNIGMDEMDEKQYKRHNNKKNNRRSKEWGGSKRIRQTIDENCSTKSYIVQSVAANFYHLQWWRSYAMKNVVNTFYLNLLHPFMVHNWSNDLLILLQSPLQESLQVQSGKGCSPSTIQLLISTGYMSFNLTIVYQTLSRCRINNFQK